MIYSSNYKSLPIKDLVLSGFIIFTTSILISKLYDPIWGVTYALGNVLILTFLRWLYQDSWNSNK